MYFSNRFELGKQFAERLPELKGREPIIFCLNEKALGASVSLASELRGWVYPFLTERVVIPGENLVYGIVNQHREFFDNPKLSLDDRRVFQEEYRTVIEQVTTEAFRQVDSRAVEYGELNRDILRGRTVILCGDVVKDDLEIISALEFLRSMALEGIITIIGNIDLLTSNYVFTNSTQSIFLDVMPVNFDPDHYFEQPEQYSLPELRQFATNISNYWT